MATYNEIKQNIQDNFQSLGIDYSKCVIAHVGYQGPDNKVLDYSNSSTETTGGVLNGNGSFIEPVGVNIINTTYGFMPLFDVAHGTPWTIILDIKKTGLNTTQAIVAGYNNSASDGYIALYPGQYARIRFATAMTFNTVSDFTSRQRLAITCDGGTTANVSLYKNGSLQEQQTTSNSAYNLNQIGSAHATYCADDATIYALFAIKEELSESQITTFNDLNNIIGSSGEGSAPVEAISEYRIDKDLQRNIEIDIVKQ